MADSPEEVVVTETLKTLQNGATEIPEEAQEMTEEGDPNGNDAEPVFSAGHLSFIGREAYVIPLSLIREFGSRTKRLDLSFNCLRSLEGIDGFTELEELLLDNNEIDDEVEFPCLPKLNTLTLNKNKIGDLDRLIQMIQVQLPSLAYLSLLGNVACPNQLSSYDKDEEDYQRYRFYVLYNLPRLKFLDSTPVRSLEVAEARRVGPFMKVVRPGSSGKSVIKETASTELPYSPLPSSKRQDGQHIGTYGACKYVYYGRHSEGNRFIRNADL